MNQNPARTRSAPNLRAIFTASGLAVLLSACGGGGGGDGGGSSTNTSDSGGCADFDCQGLLNNLANNVMLPTFQDFQSRSDQLETAVKTYRDAIDSDNETDARDDAQAAWRETMGVWQRAEVMQVGPLVDNSGTLRDNIYSWPATSACNVDQEVVMAYRAANDADTSYDIDSRTPDRRGLDALEYVLFKDDVSAECASNIAGFENGGFWDGLSDVERREARAIYAVQAAENLATLGQSLVARWDGTEGDFLAELTGPGGSDSRFDSAGEAVNAVSDALFYVEKQTKDIKLAQPVGLSSNTCGGGICAEDVESPWSRTSKDNIRNNFLAFQAMYLGNAPGEPSGPGFQDFIAQVGGTNVASILAGNTEDAIASVSDRNMPQTLSATLAQSPGLVESAHTAAKTVTDQLKNDFLEVLGLSIPSAAAGDGD